MKKVLVFAFVALFAGSLVVQAMPQDPQGMMQDGQKKSRVEKRDGQRGAKSDKMMKEKHKKGSKKGNKSGKKHDKSMEKRMDDHMQKMM